jgi:hypothetical protein
VTRESATEKIVSLARKKNWRLRLFFDGSYGDGIVRYPAFAAKVNAADLIRDRRNAARLDAEMQGAQQASRVRANDLMIHLCETAARNDLTVGFYGGRQEVIDLILERAKKGTARR